MFRIAIQTECLPEEVRRCLIEFCEEWDYCPIESGFTIAFVGENYEMGRGIVVPWIARYLSQEPRQAQLYWDLWVMAPGQNCGQQSIGALQSGEP